MSAFLQKIVVFGAKKSAFLKNRGVFGGQKVSVFTLKGGGILHPKVSGKGVYFKTHNMDGVSLLLECRGRALPQATDCWNYSVEEGEKRVLLSCSPICITHCHSAYTKYNS